MSAQRQILTLGDDDDWHRSAHAALHLAVIRRARGAREGIELAEELRPDLVITDVMLADVSGFGLCRTLREHERLSDVPIIMLSAWADEIDRVIAFECGVDDFLALPCSPGELAARVAAVLRRSPTRRSQGLSPSTDQYGVLRFDPLRVCAEVEGRPVGLTLREFHILGMLIGRGGKVVSRARILSELGAAESGASPRVIDSHVKAIRRKLGPASEYVQTVRGVGYRFAVGQ